MNTVKPIRTIRYGSEYWKLHENGYVERPGLVAPSHAWRVVGAVERNNFGHVVRLYTLQQIIDNPQAIPWTFKNGKQRTFIQDFDHGARREWRSPNHEVF